MFRKNKKTFAMGLLGLLAVAFAMPTEAEARRFYRRGFVVAPRVVVARPVVRRPVVVAPRRAYYGPTYVRAPYVGVGGYGGVNVVAPGVGVHVGW